MAIVWSNWMRRLWGGLWNAEQGIQQSGPQGFRNVAKVSIDDARAVQIGAVFRCIRIIAETGSSLPLKVYRRVQDHGEPVPDHWLQALLDTPNETMTGDELREAWLASMAGWGNAYSELVRDNSREKRVREIWPYKPDRVEVTRRKDRTLAYRYPMINGVPEEVPAEQILHLRAFSPDGIMGLSPLALARETLGVTVGAENYAASFYASGGRPSGVLTVDRLLQPEQRTQVHDAIVKPMEEGRRLMVLEAAMKYQAITVSPEDMQMLQTRAFQIAEIARFFGVPLFLLMVQENTPNWGLEQHDRAFLKYGLLPYLKRIECSLSRWLLSERERREYFVAHDLTQFLAADTKTQGEYLSKCVDSGLMTRNEGRRVLGLKPIDGADVLTANGAQSPLDKLGQRAPQPSPAVANPTEPEEVQQ